MRKLNTGIFLLPAAALLAACGSLPRTDKIQKPPWLSVTADHHETLGEFLVITPSFKILFPGTDREQLAYLESQVAAFDKMKLYKDQSYGADRTLPTNDKKTVAEKLAQYGQVAKVTPEALTISAKFLSGKKPRIAVTAVPDILDEDGTLHFSLAEQVAAGSMKRPGGTGAKSLFPQEGGAAQGLPAPDGEAGTPAGNKTADIRAYLLKKYGKISKLKRSGTVLSAAGKPLAGVEAELTLFLESARITLNGSVKNLGGARLWATYYLPQLTYRKGRDWYTFTARQFSESLSDAELKLFQISPGAEKKFQFTTDPELNVLVYDAALGRITARKAFAAREENDLLKFEMLEKYLSGSPDVTLEVFPEKMICADCGVKLY